MDAPVQVIFQPRPEFPEKLALTGLSQTGTLRALLSDDPLFTQAAINAGLHSKFRPALRQGQPVCPRVFQAIVFRQR